MTALQPQFGLRDYLGYLAPGIVVLSSYVVWNPSVVDIFKTNPIVSSIGALAGSYLAGHICKLFGEAFIYLLRRHLGINPHVKALNKKSVWGDVFREALLLKLKEVWGVNIVEQSGAFNIILLCWFDTFRNPSRGHEEVDRYLSLYNLCRSLIPAFIVMAIVCLAKGLRLPSLMAVIATFTFTWYWYKYESAFCYSILRIWYTQADAKK